MLIGSGLQALATSGKFKPLAFGQIRTAGDRGRQGNASCSAIIELKLTVFLGL
jgi:hypothetical protein